MHQPEHIHKLQRGEDMSENTNQEIRVLATNGSLGVGFREESLIKGLEMNPCVVGVDCGTSDDGPYFLGEGVPRMSREAAKWEVRLMLREAVKRKVPVLLGSAGTAGADPNVDWLVTIVKEVGEEEDLHFRLAEIKTEINSETLREYMLAGKLKPLPDAPEFTEKDLDEMCRCVGVMGVEPYQKALREGAQVVVAGRSTDTAIFSAVPLMLGAHPGYSWHSGKILECGSSCCAVQPFSDCMITRITDEKLVVEPINPDFRCTPLSVAAHTLYENANPFVLTEPGGALHTTQSKYEAETDRIVRITGSNWVPAAQYTIKLEGVKFKGYRRVVICGVKDPLVIRQLASWLDKCILSTQTKLQLTNGISPEDYMVRYHIYGNPLAEKPGEIGVMFEVIAKDPTSGDAIINSLWHTALHVPIPEWEGMQSNLAFPVCPEKLDGGKAYTFCLNHVLEVDDPCELFRFKYYDL